jgi:hypothetical protein
MPTTSGASAPQKKHLARLEQRLLQRRDVDVLHRDATARGLCCREACGSAGQPRVSSSCSRVYGSNVPSAANGEILGAKLCLPGR